MKALVGHSGFAGTTLKAQTQWDACYRSTDIADIRGRAFDLVVCAGAPAQKWIAEREPDKDRANIRALADHLAAVRAERFVLVSTVDVFANSRGAREDSAPDEASLGAYGANRLWLEWFVREHFPDALVIRLPGLVGPGLRKNAIFDFRNRNALDKIDSRALYQFYPMVNLWADIGTAMSAGLRLVHLTAEPLAIGTVAREGFSLAFDHVLADREPAAYDFQTRHAGHFGGTGSYTYSARESLLAIRAYAQSEPPARPIA